MMNKLLRSAIGCISFIFLAQLSMQDSVPGREKPRMNFYGTIVDQAGNKYDAENITISGAYNQIIMYQQPPSVDMTPSHRVRIDLAEESEIQIPKMVKPLQYKGRNYIELVLISNDKKKTKNTYIIEQSRKLYFDEPFESGPKEHETSFAEIDRIIIKGHKERKALNTQKQVAKNYAAKNHVI